MKSFRSESMPCLAARPLVVAVATSAGLLLFAGSGAAQEPLPGADPYAQNCAVCHAPDLRGVEGLGVDLVESEFVQATPMEELVEFLKEGRMPGSPQSVSGGAMPGFAWMPEDELQAIAAFLKAQP